LEIALQLFTFGRPPVGVRREARPLSVRDMLAELLTAVSDGLQQQLAGRACTVLTCSAPRVHLLVVYFGRRKRDGDPPGPTFEDGGLDDGKSCTRR